MKKIIVFIVTLIVALQTWAAVGDKFDVANLTYSVLSEATSTTPGTLSVYSLSSSGKSTVKLSIPYVVTYNSKTYHVTHVGDGAFKNNSTITSVIMKYGIQRIGKESFYNCSKLMQANLPSSIEGIGASAFLNCNSLTTVMFAIMQSKVSLGTSAFNTSTPYLYLPTGADRTQVRSSSLGSFFKTIGFSKEAYDLSLSTGELLVVTGGYGNNNHECSIIGYKVGSTKGYFRPTGTFTLSGYGYNFVTTDYADGAFQSDNDLVEVDFTNLKAVKTTKSLSFTSCQNLVKLTLATPVVQVSAIRDNPKLTVLTYAEGVDSLDTYGVVYNCQALETVEFSKTVRELGNLYFRDCPALTRLAVSTSNPYYHNSTVSGTKAIYKTSDMTLVAVANASQTLDIDPDCKTIDDNVFFQSSLKDVIIPFGVKKVGRAVFNGSLGINSVFVPSSAQLSNLTFVGKNIKNLYVNNYHGIPNDDAHNYQWEGMTCDNMYIPYASATDKEHVAWLIDEYKLNSVNPGGMVAYDHHEVTGDNNNFYYTVTSTEPCTINGTRYDGRAKLVKAIITGNIPPASGVDACSVPAHITINKKNYAVTCIGEEAFDLKVKSAVTGSANVDSVLYRAFDSETNLFRLELPYVSYIGEEACDDCTNLSALVLSNRLRRIEKRAFCNAPLDYEIVQDGIREIACKDFAKESDKKLTLNLPYGFERLGYRAFQNSHISALLIPSSASIDGSALYKMGNLQSLLINLTSVCNSDYEYDLTGVPSTCNLYVPATYADRFVAHPSWSKFKNNTFEGSYDIRHNIINCFYTVTLNRAYYVGKDVFDGTVEVVFNPSNNKPLFDPYITFLGKRYAITAIGDRCYYGLDNLTSVYLGGATNLKRIGNEAFCKTSLTELAIPKSVLEIGANALSDIPTLTNVTLLGDDKKAYPAPFLGNNSDNIVINVKSNLLYSYYNSMAGWNVSAGKTAQDRLAPYIIPEHDTQMFSACTQLNPPAGVTLNYVKSVDSATGIAATAKRSYVFANYGYLLTGLTPGEMYKFTPNNTSNARMPNNMLRDVATTPLDLGTVANAYVWNAEDKVFEKPAAGTTLPSSSAYLLGDDYTAAKYYADLFPAPAPDFKTGDVNGDDVVDITDINILINIVLGKDDASKYKGADVDGSGEVDITDVNTVLNIVLGK